MAQAGAKPETVARTPNQWCPACCKSRIHTAAEMAVYHPLAGHGLVKEMGWTRPDLAPEATRAR